MAVEPHCVVCGAEPVGAVEFADYSPDWREPVGPSGVPIVGWSNELGVTAPPGVGLFCERHLRRARRLRRLRAADAVRRLRGTPAPEKLRAWLAFRRRHPRA